MSLMKHRPERPPAATLIAAFALVFAAACGKDEPAPTNPIVPPPQTTCTRLAADSLAAPDFLLADVNPNSTTHGLGISPRCQVGKVSAWYFGFAT